MNGPHCLVKACCQLWGIFHLHQPKGTLLGGTSSSQTWVLGCTPSTPAQPPPHGTDFESTHACWCLAGDLTPHPALARQPQQFSLHKCVTVKERYGICEADKDGGQGRMIKAKLFGRMLWHSVPPGMTVSPTSSSSYSSGPRAPAA